ncbi:MAG: hypothetical protein LKK42_00255 [Oscillospiraceae bacterium]|jgi:hypothetical protein|nr:hypothetical protein [Oscillospiraceae bacterium]
MINTKIEHCNNLLLDKEKAELIQEIVYGNNRDYFKIFDIEAGCRKTRTAEIALAKLVTDTDKSAVFVRSNIVDCLESAKNIDSIVGEQVAFAYNSQSVNINNTTAIQKKFPNIRILIITHAKYFVLAKNRGMRNVFTKNRQILVIDEFVDDVRKLSLSLSDINSCKKLFLSDMEMEELYLDITCKLENAILASKEDRSFLMITKDYIPKNINQLLKYIRSNFTESSLKVRVANTINEYGNTINSALLGQINTKRQLCNKISEIKEFYNQTCLYNQGTIYTTDSKCRPWLMDNNVMLDASGDLQIAYNLNNNLYHLENAPRVLDHSLWTLINIPVNTTTAGKNRIQNYYDIVNRYIQKYDLNDILVVGNQHELDKINVPKDHKAYFGNITGSNKWADLSNAAIIQTTNIDDTDYILKYIHYSKELISSTFGRWVTKSTGRNTLDRYQFRDPQFEHIRTLWIAEQTYQAIKRVNRNMNHVTNVLIFMNNPDVIELLQKKLAGCKVKTLEENDFIPQWNKQDVYIKSLQESSYASKFKQLMAELINGEHMELECNSQYGLYTKKSIREYLGISNPTVFSNKVLAKTDVVTFCKIRNINTAGKYIKLVNQQASA